MGTATEVGLSERQRGVAVDGFLNVGGLRRTGLRLNPGEGEAQPNLMVSVFTADSIDDKRITGTVIAEGTWFTPKQRRFQNGSEDRPPGSRVDLRSDFRGLVGGPEDPTARSLQDLGIEIWLVTEPDQDPRVQIFRTEDTSPRPDTQSPHHELLTLPVQRQ